MDFDGQVEAEAITARLSTLVGGRVSEGVTDDADMPRNTDGSIKAFIDLIYGRPIPSATDRTIMGEREQPQIFPFSVVIQGPDAETVRAVDAAVTNLLFDWRPSPTASGCVPDGGRDFSEKATETRPSRHVRRSGWLADINL